MKLVASSNGADKATTDPVGQGAPQAYRLLKVVRTLGPYSVPRTESCILDPHYTMWE